MVYHHDAGTKLFERNIFSEALHVLIECWRWALAVSLIVLVVVYVPFWVGWWQMGRVSDLTTSCLLIFLSYRAYAVLLSVDCDEATHLRRAFGLMMRIIGIGLLFSLPFFIVLFGIFFLIGSGNLSNTDFRYFLLVIVMLLFFGGVAIVLGTYSAAYVAGRGRGGQKLVNGGRDSGNTFFPACF